MGPAANHPTNPSLALPTWTPSSPLVHIGSMSREEEGVRTDCYEGPGLSVSEWPGTWPVIARLSGERWWQLSTKTSSAATFLDWHATTGEARAWMVAWAVEEGYAAAATGYRVSWYDTEHAQWASMTTPDGKLALSEYSRLVKDYEGEASKAPHIGEFVGWSLTPKALQALARKDAELDETPFLAAILYCEANTTLDGVYWADELDVTVLSAPRAVIFPDRLQRFLIQPWATAYAEAATPVFQA